MWIKYIQGNLLQILPDNMRKEDNHFDEANKDFKEMKKSGQIPPQMQVKLDYLLSRINGKGEDNIPNIADLPEYERSSLQQLNSETGVQLFCNIVNCLSGKDVVLYFRDEKAYIRKDETFSMWATCYITCDSNNVFIKKKPDRKPAYHFSIVDLRISKNFKPYKKKIVFGASYRKKENYLIGFDLEIACARTHELLRNLIRQQVARKNNTLGFSSDLSAPSIPSDDERSSFDHQMLESQQIPSTPIKKSFQKKKSKHSQSSLKAQEEDREKVQEEGYLYTPAIQTEPDEEEDKVLSIIKEYQMVGEEAYTLTKNQGQYREFIHRKYPNKIKQILLMDSKQDQTEGKQGRIGSNIVNMYISMNEWNPEIEECQVMTKISNSCYLLQIRVKKYSYLAWPRGVVVVADAVNYRGNTYLYLRNIEEEPAYTDTVKMEWSQLIEICEGLDKTKLLVTIASQFDFKGYCSVQDSQRMGLKVMNNLKLFESFVQSKQISGKFITLFHLEQPNPLRSNSDHSSQRKKRQNKTRITEKTQQSEAKEQKTPKSPPMTKNLSKSATLTKDKQRDRKMSQESEFSVPDQENYERSDLNDIEDLSKECSKKKECVGETFPEVRDPMSFIMYMMNTNQNSEISGELIEQIRRKAHQRYFLRHKFDQQPHIDPSRLEHRAEEPNHYVLQNGDWMFNKDNDAIFVNQEVINMQKDVLKFVLKQLSSNLMSGKSIMNMSLPVEIFDGRSILERVAMGFGFAPKILVPAAETENIIQQAKMVVSFAIGIGPLHLNMTKPFNPILGETFQCSVGGIPIYMEQISHHPPISAFYMKTEGFRFFGSFHSHAEMGLNQVNGKNLTPIFLQFPKTKTFYEIKTMDMEVSGLMYGDKRYRPEGKCYIHQRTNNLFVQFATGKDKKKVYQADQKPKPNLFYGGIFTVSEKFGKKFRQCENKRKFDGLKPDDVIETHAKINGHWALYLDFDGERFRTLENPLPNKIQYPKYTLPSDSNFRLDLIYKRMGQLKQSNEEKEILENIQRRDRKLREGKIKEK